MRRNILSYLEETAARLPGKIALSDGKNSLNFGEVLQKSRSAGSFLADYNLWGEPCLVLMDKHPNTVCAFFGIIYAGGHYVCIDESMPRARIGLILENISPRAVITDKKNHALAQSLGLEFVFLFEDICGEKAKTSVLGEIRKKQLDTDPIYIVFTSGSTGVPKGVVACHRSVIDYTDNLSSALGFSEDTVFGNQTPLYFDAPLKEIMPTLKFGASVYFIPKFLFSFPVRLIEYLNAHKINTVCWVVSAFVQVSSLGALEVCRPEHLHTIAFGSEVFPENQYRIWRSAMPRAKFFNLYGPTEATGMSCFWEADRELEPGESIPIGQPFENTGIILLDAKNRKTEQGESGEICIRGTCVTLGYYNNPDKTGEVFVQNPLNSRYPEIIYRTGDIGRYNKYGELVFVARKDSQIKHMGHRIELAEIEALAAKHPLILRACAVYDPSEKEIFLFYTAGGELSPEALAEYFSQMLPRYMLPAKCEALSEMPYTANGKLDRVGLLARATKNKNARA